MSDWNSTQYIKFKKERTQPAYDLIQRIHIRDPFYILDVGCGSGNSTYALKGAFPGSYLLGIDASHDMLQKANEMHPEIFFKHCMLPEGLSKLHSMYDLIFSNACIQWIEDQEELIEKLVEKLNPGGVLAIQVPYIQKAPFHQILQKVIKEKWRQLENIRNVYNLLPEEYYDIVTKLKMNCTLWTTTYYHTLSSHEDILQWYMGSSLRPYMDVLNEEEKKSFKLDLLQEIQKMIPVQANGEVLLKMPRIFFVAQK